MVRCRCLFVTFAHWIEHLFRKRFAQTIEITEYRKWAFQSCTFPTFSQYCWLRFVCTDEIPTDLYSFVKKHNLILSRFYNGWNCFYSRSSVLCWWKGLHSLHCWRYDQSFSSLIIDPENTRGGEINGEPYVQPSLFSHLLKSLKPGIPNSSIWLSRSGFNPCPDSSLLLISSFSSGASWRYAHARWYSWFPRVISFYDR